MGRRDFLDRFYTKKEIASYCISLLNIKDYKTIIEPSAGNGSFSNQIPNCLAFDICPGSERILKKDFFTFNRSHKLPNPILVIGNPPFGRQNSMAIRFINFSSLFADTIAFILPKSFKKDSLKSRIPLNFHLKKEIDLPDYSFTLNNKEINIPCIFQIWEKKSINRELLKKLFPIGFFFVKKNENPNIAVRRVGVYAGKAFEDTDKSIQSHYFIIADDVDDFLKIINNIKWEHDNTVGPKSISKQELIRKYNNIKLGGNYDNN